MRKTNDLGKDNIFGLVLRLAIPAMLAQLVNVLYTVVDRIFIGNIPLVGDIALAGVGVCAPIAEFLAS
ncbi:MAG: MATE family efflux transporter, partial [Oscillospiraceae bacterium]|nr:MATE family efflux transporter [Oscillospiraceae bacterium]